MRKSIFYCVICGAKINHGIVCSVTCSKIYSNFQCESIKGFCNFCGYSLIIKRGSEGEIWNNHIKCYVTILSRNLELKLSKVKAENEIEKIKDLKKEFRELVSLKKKLRKSHSETEFCEVQILKSEVKRIHLRNIRLEKERLEKERLEEESLEKERLEKESLEKERLEKERLEKESLEKERLEKEKLRKKRLERKRENENKRLLKKLSILRKFDSDSITNCLSLFDDEKEALICPHCLEHSVTFSTNLREWYCNHCKSNINFKLIFDVDLIFDDAEKYKIYKIWGIDALAKLTGRTSNSTQRFVSSYFENCCSSKGDGCVYFNCLEGVEIRAKQVQSIISLFENSKRNYEKLSHEINQFSENIEKNQFSLSEMKQRETYKKYISFKNTVEQIIGQLDNSLVVLANEDLEKNIRVYVKESNGELIADFSPDGIEGFVWNNTKKGEMVGISFISVDFFSEINQHFIDFQQEIDCLIKSSSLSPREKEVMYIITSEKGILQNHLWRNLNIDSRKCSRIVKSLFDKNLIRREVVASNGARTYLLLPAYNSQSQEFDFNGQ